MEPFPPAWQVPAFEVRHEQPKGSPYAVCVFVLNEGARLEAQLRRMQPFAGVADLVIADGGSTDGAPGREILDSGTITALLVKTGAGRLGSQMRMAFAWALARGYEGIVTIDGNGKDVVEAIPDFCTLLRDGWDHVQGSRYIPGGHHENTPWSRHYGVKFLHAPLISLAARFRYTDTTNGFRAYSRRFLLDPRVEPFRDCFTGYELHYYLAIRAARLGFRCIEAPVTRRYPSAGAVPTKITPIKGNLGVLRSLIKAATGAFDP